MFDLVIYR